MSDGTKRHEKRGKGFPGLSLGEGKVVYDRQNGLPVTSRLFLLLEVLLPAIS